MIAIIGVAREETGFFKSLSVIKSQKKTAGLDFYTGTLEATEVVLVSYGMGKLPAAIATQIVIDCYNVDSIIATGPAGPLVPYLQQGDMVVADRLVQYQPERPGSSEIGQDMMAGNTLVTSNAGLIPRVVDSYGAVFGGKSNRPQLVVGTVVSSDQAIPDRKSVGRLQRDYGVVAIDRDAATVARVCRMNEKPFLLIRTVVDTPDGDFYNYFDSQLQVAPEYITALIRQYIAAPSLVPVE